MPAEVVGSVVSGVVALHETLADGRRQMVGLLFPSDFVGRPLRNTALHGAVATTQVRMCMFERARFERILTDNPSLERRLLEMTLDELDAARHWNLVLGRKTAREKIASFLLMLANRVARSDGVGIRNRMAIPIPISRESIADFLGLTIETVSRQFTALRKSGTLALEDARTARILDLDSLANAAGEDGSGVVGDKILRA